MPRDYLEELGIEVPRKENRRDLFEELGIKHPMQEQGEVIQSRHPKTADFLGKLSDTDIGQFSQWLAKGAEPVNRLAEEAGISDIAGGLLEGAENIPISILNTPSYIGEKITGQKFPQLPYADLSVFKEDRTKGPAWKGGNIVGSIASGGPLSRLFAGHQAINALNPRNVGMLENALRGAAAGYSMMGESNNRELGAALGAGVPFAVGALERAAPYMRAVTQSGVGKNAGELYGKNKGAFNQEYNQMSNKFRSSGANSAYKDPYVYEDAAEILKRMDPKNKEHFKEFLKEPSLDSAHRAKSEIKDFMKSLQKKAKKNGGSWKSQDTKSFEVSEKIVNDLEKSMNDAFLASKNPELAKEYADLSARYAKEMGPYIDLPAFAGYAAKEVKPRTLAKKILANDKFMQTGEPSKIPGLKTRELFDEVPLLGKILRMLS